MPFKKGHIQTWWRYFLRVPSELRPIFCPVSKLGDSFILCSETAILSLLWGNTNSKTRPARHIMESQVCSSEMAHELASEKYGELFRLLFIRYKVETKADPLKNQTSYGKKTTTMNRLLKDHPNTYGQAALDGYMKRVFANHKARKQAAAEGTEPPVPPAFPSNDSVKEHYAISNMMRTDGVQLHLMAFEIRRRWQSYKIKTRIPEITS
ncbi:hypothetical protein BC939DRAFT_32337 [Gamsiella multidivaricata]|uniref:uncharacterized protein n=1 Tax=Gamsiella multidivaricata TaxID=101098 RepID=UPI00221ED3D7|nr:uncharacterized protein BC939DRAFT_32337 [Gamsiella multidivaricata]KAI7816749.1 hypothetical protein BC939DRAFT_32337 [Gamsiella multidivaricata]